MSIQTWLRTLLLLAWLSLWWIPEATAQPWYSAEAIPLFCGTEAQDRALRKLMDSTACRANLRTLGSAARLYAHDHADHLPQNWSDFTNQITKPAALYCPADALRPAQSNWAQVELATISYEILAPGADLGAPSQTYLRCKVHGNTCSTRGLAVMARPYDGRGFPLSYTNSFRLAAPALLAAKEGAVSLNCQNNLRQMGLAARLFATDHAGLLPVSFAEIADALDSLQILVCPSDVLRSAVPSLSALSATNLTYRIVAPGVHEDVTPKQPFITCPIHGHHLDTDGAVTPGTNRYPPRLIIGHPLSWTVEPGQPVELAVLIGDPSLGPFRYQWRRQQPFDAAGDPFTNSTVLAEATNRIYRIPAASAADEGYYDVIVYDAQGGYQLSHLAFLRVESLTNVSARFAWEAPACFNNLKAIGLAARMFASANQDLSPDGYTNLAAYLGWPLSLYCPSDRNRPAPNTWEAVDFSNLSYTLEPDVLADSGTNVLATCKVHHYYVQADGTVKLGDIPPAIFLNPASQATFVGRAAALRVGALGDSKNYQWFKNNEAIAGETNSTLTLPGPAVTNTASYHAVVANLCGSVTSRVAVLTVNSIPPPRLQCAVTSAGAELALSLAGPAGVECVFEASPDLMSWTKLSTNVLTEGMLTFLQQMDTSLEARFYRVTLR